MPRDEADLPNRTRRALGFATRRGPGQVRATDGVEAGQTFLRHPIVFAAIGEIEPGTAAFTRRVFDRRRVFLQRGKGRFIAISRIGVAFGRPRDDRQQEIPPQADAIGRAGPQGFLVLQPRRGDIAAGRKDVPLAQMQRMPTGARENGRIEMADRGGDIPMAGHDPSEAIVAFRVPGVDRQGGTKSGNRLLFAAHLIQRRPEMIARLVPVEIERGAFRIVTRGIPETPHHLAYLSQAKTAFAILRPGRA